MMLHALALADRGWHIFPVSPGTKIPLKGWTDWESRATNDIAEVTKIWTENPDANLGLACGPSSLLVLDFDSAKSPQERSGIENFREAYPGRKLPGTFTVRTPSGGWHLIFRAPSRDLRNSAGKLAERVDTRGKGGYVLAPGSSIGDNTYEIVADAPLADLPEWIVKALEDKPVVRTNVKPKGSSTAYALAALRRECEALANTSEGGRNHATNRAAWNCSRFVARGELDEDMAWSELLGAALLCGLPTSEAQAAVNSGMTRGMKHYEE